MSATELETFLSQPYSYAHFRDFITQSFGHHIHIKSEASYNYHEGNIIKSYTQVCEPIILDSQRNLCVYAFKTRSINAKVGLHKEIASILKTSTFDAVLAVFYEEDSQEFRLSLVSRGYDYEANRQTFSNFRRQSFVLGHEKIKTAKTQLQDFIDKEQKSLESLQKAFSTEPLSKEFYKRYEELFSTLSDKLIKHQAALNILQGYEGLSGEKAVQAFVKKLLGRIVFLYFLQKKGWLGVEANATYGSGDRKFLYSLFQKAKENNQSFYKDYLCPLFFDSLNTKRENDYFAPFDCKIPFLNGGLFEEAKKRDSKGCEIGIDTHFIICEILSNSEFEAVFDVFERYNFTIEESIPNDEEIGIDPEMLGKIFENLIDYNKSSGAFYTPKSIVHFMCKNALMRTLQEKLCYNEEEKDSIYALIFALESDNPFIAQNRQAIIDTLKNLTILDPAIGSGAFPMGLLSEILQILCNLDPMLNRAQIAALKREIIQKSIYGIDIDADAIEVAKLRFWLSIAVDEEAPTPLPNLDFNFMQGNSLLERIENIEIMPSSFHSKDTQRDLWGKRDSDTSLFDKSQVDKLITLFSAFFEENDATKKHSLKREILNIIESAFNERIAQIESEIQSERDNPKVKPRECAAQQDKIHSQENFIKELRELLNDYKTKDFHTDKLFLYRFFFARVFKNGGFDICIGNMPYIRQEEIKHLKPKLQKAFNIFEYAPKKYQFFNSNADIYTYFYAKGLEKIKPKGFLSFITSNKWCRAGYGKNLREFLLNVRIDSHIDLNGVKIFESATVDTAITTLQSAPYTDKHHIMVLGKITKEQTQDLSIFIKTNTKIPQDSLNTQSFIFSDSKLTALKAKIEAKGTPLKDWDININYGIKTGYNEAFIIDSEKREEILAKCDDSKASLLPYSLSEYDKNLNTDTQSPSSEIHSHCNKIKSHEVPPLKASSGRGIYKGEGATSQFKPLPLIEKETARVIEKTKSVLESSKIDLENNTILLTERERTAQLIKPILRGRDIKRYSYEWAGLWIINVHNGYKDKQNNKILPINIEEYPTLKAYFDDVAKSGKQGKGKGFYNRDDKGITPYNLRNCAYLPEFAKPKIIYSEIVREPQFYLDNGEFKFGHFYAEATSFILSGNENFKDSLEYLLGILHSKLATFAFKEFYAGGGLGESGYRYKKAFLEKLPIPKISKKQELEFVKIVQKILESKKANEDANELEKCLDSKIFALYDLNDEEIAIIAPPPIVIALLLLSAVDSLHIELVKILCENFESEFKEAFKFCEGLKMPYISKEKYEGKIIYPNMAKEFIAYLDTKGFFTNQKCFILTDNIKDKDRLLYLSAVLNSKTNFWYFKQIGATLGASGYEMSKIFVERLPIVETQKIDSKILSEIETLAKEILETKTLESSSENISHCDKNQSHDNANLESRLDSLIYQVYDLTHDEINLIESEFKKAERERVAISENLYHLWKEYSKTYQTSLYEDKLIWAELARSGNSFVVDDKGYYLLAGAFLLTLCDKSQDIFYLASVLNNPLALFYLEQVYSKLDETGWQWKKEPVEKIPIPKIDSTNKDLAEEIIAMTRQINLNKDKSLESNIKEKVYKLYNLSKDEITLLESFATSGGGGGKNMS